MSASFLHVDLLLAQDAGASVLGFLASGTALAASRVVLALEDDHATSAVGAFARDVLGGHERTVRIGWFFAFRSAFLTASVL